MLLPAKAGNGFESRKGWNAVPTWTSDQALNWHVPRVARSVRGDPPVAERTRQEGEWSPVKDPKSNRRRSYTIRADVNRPVIDSNMRWRRCRLPGVRGL